MGGSLASAARRRKGAIREKKGKEEASLCCPKSPTAAAVSFVRGASAFRARFRSLPGAGRVRRYAKRQPALAPSRRVRRVPVRLDRVTTRGRSDRFGRRG